MVIIQSNLKTEEGDCNNIRFYQIKKKDYHSSGCSDFLVYRKLILKINLNYGSIVGEV